MLKKQDRVSFIQILILAILLVPHPTIALEPFLVGRVIGITDGDTVVLLDDFDQQHKIRLSGIDAPEKSQPFGQASKDNLSRNAYGKLVVAECPKTDKYGRAVCLIRVNGEDINLKQISSGLAWHYKEYAAEQPAEQRAGYSLAEDEARTAKIGLWADTAPIAPWEWRHEGKSRPETQLSKPDAALAGLPPSSRDWVMRSCPRILGPSLWGDCILRESEAARLGKPDLGMFDDDFQAWISRSCPDMLGPALAISCMNREKEALATGIPDMTHLSVEQQRWIEQSCQKMLGPSLYISCVSREMAEFK